MFCLITYIKRAIARNALVAVTICLLSGIFSFGQTAGSSGEQALIPNQSIERAITNGETQEFEFKVKRGRFIHIEVEPANINLVLTLIAEDGKTVVEVDGDLDFLWRESLSALADKDGIYKLRVKGIGAVNFTGRFSVKLSEPKKPEANDLKRIEAERVVAQAIKLSKEKKNKEAAAAFETVIKLWQEIGDKYWETVSQWNLAWSYRFTGRGEDALKLFSTTVVEFQNLKDRVGEAAALGGVGVIYNSANKYEEARIPLEKSLTIVHELNRLVGEFNRRRQLVGVYFGLKQPDKALENLNRMLEISRELKTREGERDTFNMFGLFLAQTGNNEDAGKFFEQALEIDRELRDTPGQIDRLTFLSFVYEKLSQNEKVEKALNEALELAKSAKDDKREGGLLKDLGSFYLFLQSDYDKARRTFVQALAKLEHGVDRENEGNVLDLLSTVSMALGENNDLITYSQRGYEIKKELDDHAGQISLLNQLAGGYFTAGKVDDAFRYNEQALDIARKQKLKKLEAITLNTLALRYNALQQYEKGLKLNEEALIIAREMHSSTLIGIVLGNLGDAYMFSRQYDKAQEKYEEALQLSREAKSNNRESQALHKLGLLFAAQRRFDKAQEYFEKVLKIAEENKFTDRAIYVQSSMGFLYSSQNQYETAIGYFEKAYRQAKETKNLSWQTSLLISLGSMHSATNQFEKARGYFEQSLSMAKEVRDRSSQAIALIGLGDMYFKLNQYENALDNFKQVEEIAKETRNRWLLGYATGGIGSINTDLSQNQRAQGNYEQSLTLMKEVLDRSGEGSVLNSLGNTYLNLKDYEKAQSYYEQSLAIARETKNKAGEVGPLINLGIVFQKKEQFDKAQISYEQGLLLAREVKDRGSEGYAIRGLGEVSLKLKKYRLAEEYYLQSLSIAREIQSKKLEGSVLQDLMGLYKEMKKSRLAILYGKLAVNIYQGIRGNIQKFDKESQQTYLKDKEEAYRTLADILISQDRFLEAQAILKLLKEEEYSQLSRGDVKSEIVPYSGVESDSMEKIENLISLERQREGLSKIKPRTSEQEAAIASLSEKINEANANLENTLKGLASNEKFAGARVDEFFRNKNLKGTLTGLKQRTNSGVVALYTLLGDVEETGGGKKDQKNEKTKFGWIILVTEKSHKAYPIDVTDFNKTVFEFRDALASDKYDPQPLAKKLYNAIFRQSTAKQKRTLEQDLQAYLAAYPNKTLMWSLDGVLRYIPMAALHDGKDYLVEKYRNVLFTELSEKYLLGENRPAWEALGLGVSDGRDGFQPLPGVKTELEAIVRGERVDLGVLNGTIQLNDNFRKLAFLNEVANGEYSVIHIASHYSFKPGQQKESFLLTGDGRLTFGEMEKNANLFGAVDLLTLSACDTGVSDNGKEAEGFSYKAQELGAKSVIASLWKVSDQGTPELMIRFYRLMSENPSMSKGEAFQRAQLSLLGAETKKDGNSVPAVPRGTEMAGQNEKKIDLPLFVKDAEKPFAHPHYWASFVLIGNWR